MATVAQAKDELEVQHFDSGMAWLSKLIDTENVTFDLLMKRQERCKDPERVARYDEEIDQHMANIEEYCEQLEQLQQSLQKSNKQVDALLGSNDDKEN